MAAVGPLLLRKAAYLGDAIPGQGAGFKRSRSDRLGVTTRADGAAVQALIRWQMIEEKGKWREERRATSGFAAGSGGRDLKKHGVEDDYQGQLAGVLHSRYFVFVARRIYGMAVF